MARYECTDCTDKSDDGCVLTIENEKNDKHPDTCIFGAQPANWVCCGDG